VRVVVLPPDQMFPTLKLGYIDGFCGGEPWTSLAVEAGVGVSVCRSSELMPSHPETVLMVRRDFAEQHAAEHERLIAALIEACAFCDRPENRVLLSEILSQPHYLNAPADCLKRALAPPPARVESATVPRKSCTLFHQHDANDPTDDKAAWLVENLYESMQQMDQSHSNAQTLQRTPVLKNVFRRDVYQRALALAASQATTMKREADAYAATFKRVA